MLRPLAVVLLCLIASPATAFQFTCDDVRAFVAEHGKAKAIAFAVSHGAAAFAGGIAKVGGVAELSTTLARLPPLQQIERLRELSATSPVARNLAAILVKPELIGLQRAQLESALGAEPVAAARRLPRPIRSVRWRRWR